MSYLNVYAVDFEDYEEKVQKLKDTAPNKVEYGTDRIDIDITAKQDELMCVAVPYLPGWSVTVDGVSEKIYKANERYMGVMLTKGDHKVKLVYNRPLQKEGIILTIAGAAAFAAICIFTEINKRKRRSNPPQ